MREAKTLMAALWPGTLRPHCHPVDACCMHYHLILRGVYYLFWDAIATIASNLWRFTIFKKRLKLFDALSSVYFPIWYDMRMRTISVLSFHLRCRQAVNPFHWINLYNLNQATFDSSILWQHYVMVCLVPLSEKYGAEQVIVNWIWNRKMFIVRQIIIFPWWFKRWRKYLSQCPKNKGYLLKTGISALRTKIYSLLWFASQSTSCLSSAHDHTTPQLLQYS